MATLSDPGRENIHMAYHMTGSRWIASCLRTVWTVVALITASQGWIGTVHAADASHLQREVWVGLRHDGRYGTGTITDPFDASTVEKLNALFSRFQTVYGDNLTVHFAPGVYEGDRLWVPRNNWKIRGAGMDVTIFRTKANPNRTDTVGFRDGGYTGGPSGFELSDVTFDFNTPNMRKANRVFTYPEWTGREVSYFYAKELPEWSIEKEYARGMAVRYKGGEYIVVTASKGLGPDDYAHWAVLRPCQPGKLPKWSEARAYGVGDAVSVGTKAYLCLAKGMRSKPADDPKSWRTVRSDAPDPLIYTHAAFVCARPPGGRNRVSRVRAINGNGSEFFNREDFVIGLGGNDCVVEDCIVEQFHGDYGTLIVLFFGQNGVVRGCTVRGNNGSITMAYGGWACYDTVFENNYCSNVRSATNIDSLDCRNVTFRNNVFLGCRESGILVNVGGDVISSLTQYSMPIDGKDVPIARTQMDGLFIYNNLIEMREGASMAGIHAQNAGLRNVRISNNMIRSSGSTGRGMAIVVGKGVKNVLITGNSYDIGMRCDVPPDAVLRD